MTPAEPRVFIRDVDPSDLDELFREIERACTDLTARVRPATAREAPPGPVSLAEARRALDAGDSIQLRYRAGGTEWIDTLQPVRGGARLIRCAPPTAG